MNHNNINDKLTPGQRAGRDKFVKDLRKSIPDLMKMGRSARKEYEDFINAPAWHLTDAPRGAGFEEPWSQHWTVGHAQVNYVDHIDTPLDDEDDQ